MGYYVNMELSGMIIPESKKKEALDAINDLHNLETMKKHAHGGCWSNGTQTEWYYSWVGNPLEGGFKSLVEAFESWRYRAVEQENGDVEIKNFIGEKLGDCDVLWKALENFVDPTGEISVVGEDSDSWSWVFKNNKFAELRQ